MALKPFFSEGGTQAPDEGEVAPVPLGGTRTEASQRLQIGAVGLGGMLLLIGLANVITDRAQQTSDEAVPEATPPAFEEEVPAQSDPLADAGVVPELPAEPEAELDEAGEDPTADLIEESDASAGNAAQ